MKQRKKKPSHIAMSDSKFSFVRKLAPNYGLWKGKTTGKMYQFPIAEKIMDANGNMVGYMSKIGRKYFSA